MAEIRPFRGVRYNQNSIPNMAAVICPPYDVISPQQQNELYQASEYNFVRIENNRELPQDNAQDNRYTRAAQNLTGWLDRGILREETTPSCIFTSIILPVRVKAAVSRIWLPASGWKSGTVRLCGLMRILSPGPRATA